MFSVATSVESKLVLDRLRNLERMLGGEFLSFFLTTDVVQILQHSTENRFDSEGADVGGWQALSPATVDIREMLGFPGAHPINVRTGYMKDVLTNANGIAMPSAFGAGMNWPENIGSSNDIVPKVTTAQMGNGDKTPARPVISAEPEDLIGTMSAIAAHLTVAGVIWG